MLPDLPMLTGEGCSWIILGLKVVGAIGFMAATDTLILYAC